MTSGPELQRLLARGANTLPSAVVLDVEALLRWIAEVDPTSDPWPDIINVAKKSTRRFLFVLAPTAAPCMAVSDTTRSSVWGQLQSAGMTYVRSMQPAPALVASVDTPFTFVTAGVMERPYEVWFLQAGAVVLDVGTGRTWSASDVAEQWCQPGLLPLFWAATGQEPELAPATSFAREPRYREAILHALRSTGSAESDELPARVQRELNDRRNDIQHLAAMLKGMNAVDAAARNVVGAHLQPVTGAQPTGTIYVVARTSEDNGVAELQEVIAIDASGSRHEHGPAACNRLLSSLPRGKWFAPRALDLLDAMFDAGLPLPAAVVDPALCSYVIDPDSAMPPEDFVPLLHALPTAARAWMSDLKRRRPAPTDLTALAELLPEVDTSLVAELQQRGLGPLIEDDVAPTLPVLASIERWGAWQTYTDAKWSMLGQLWCDEFNEAVAVFPESEVDLARANLETVVRELRRVVQLLPSEEHPAMSAEQRFDRILALGVPAAAAIHRARTIIGSTSYWHRELRSRTRLRTKHVPTVTGRWELASLPLGQLPSRTDDAMFLRPCFGAPPGYVLIGADWNAFKARLLAGLSRDPLLLQAAAGPDMHEGLAKQIFGDVTMRNAAKAAVYAIIYGQSRDGFWRSQPRWTRQEAEALYDKVSNSLPGVDDFRRSVLRTYRRRGVTTGGGWRRLPTKRSAAFNTVVQGLGADVLRWVLRELHAALARYGGVLVHQHHDEIIAAVPEEHAGVAAQVIEWTMDADVRQRSGLVDPSVGLPARIKSGSNWWEVT